MNEGRIKHEWMNERWIKCDRAGKMGRGGQTKPCWMLQ